MFTQNPQPKGIGMSHAPRQLVLKTDTREELDEKGGYYNVKPLTVCVCVDKKWRKQTIGDGGIVSGDKLQGPSWVPVECARNAL